MRPWLQHHLNAMHVRCVLYRLSDRIARAWERVAHPLLYGGSRG
jgi:hypothetical protein